MNRLNRKLSLLAKLLVIVPFIWSQSALSQQGGVSVEAGGGGGVSDGLLIGVKSFFFSDEASLGAESLNTGSAVLNRFDLQYNFSDYFSGLGFFYETDTYGTIQKDTIMGGVFEIYLGNLFVKMMTGNITQDFTRRSFDQRIGTFSAFEAGIRAALISNLAYYEISIQKRTKTITTEDEREMASPFAESQTFPTLGVGISI